jgi:hypothetical protein
VVGYSLKEGSISWNDYQTPFMHTRLYPTNEYGPAGGFLNIEAPAWKYMRDSEGN